MSSLDTSTADAFVPAEPSPPLPRSSPSPPSPPSSPDLEVAPFLPSLPDPPFPPFPPRPPSPPFAPFAPTTRPPLPPVSLGPLSLAATKTISSAVSLPLEPEKWSRCSGRHRLPGVGPVVAVQSVAPIRPTVRPVPTAPPRRPLDGPPGKASTFVEG